MTIGMRVAETTEKGMQYEVLKSPSACLYPPHGAELVMIRPNKSQLLFEDFMIQQGAPWTEFLKPRGKGKTKLNSVCVITKVYLTTSWAIASSETAEPGSTVTLIHNESDPEVLRWEDSPVDIKTYVSPPRESSPEDGTPARPTECIAVGGYKLDPPGQFIQSLTDIRQGVRSSMNKGVYVTSMFERF
ncbi:unnamed protein product [Cyclocybe aegerita]|uniref:Uncharacterized protein n=1 Tax=Cyclocybe aegerita TaxID=1973307 RepID=A0A8S0WTR3_CYCAE|nr:unnamed protein product [Cyclocybe aegerita]